MRKKIILAIVLLLLISIGIFLASRKTVSIKKEDTEEIPTPTVTLPTISDYISVDFIPRSDRKAVALRIKGLSSDIESIEYELTYITKAGLPRGVLGKIVVKPGEKDVQRNDIVLGTCSSGKCVYDEGVTSIDVSIKFNSSAGPHVFQKTYEL